MKDTLTDANFPRTADARVYHLGLCPGEVANRIVTVGSHSRARTLQGLLDAKPEPFILASERGFLTITGRYKNVPISIVSIGMGYPNMDFFVREVRECLLGDMVVIRLGSCGALVDVPVGTIVVPKASVMVVRNVDYDFVNSESSEKPPYLISKLVSADPALHTQVTFYSSQGRQTSFPDHNADLIERLKATVPDLATFEMETFHLFHLAACWAGRNGTNGDVPQPLTERPAEHAVLQDTRARFKPLAGLANPDSVIRAAAALIVFAARNSREFITPEEVQQAERLAGTGILNALIKVEIPDHRLHPEKASVWGCHDSV
ncbi:Nucleoside phosphorylase domain containing protein [Amanita muscaria]